MLKVRACAACGKDFSDRQGDVCAVCRFWSKVGPADANGCRDWQAGRYRAGYGAFKAQGRQIKAHRFAYELANGPIPDGLFACHRCDRPCCVAVEHIFIGTSAENTADRDAKGRTARGERSGSVMHPEKLLRGEESPRARLTWEQVQEARARLAGGQTHRSIAARFGVARTTISAIARGEIWKQAS